MTSQSLGILYPGNYMKVFIATGDRHARGKAPKRVSETSGRSGGKIYKTRGRPRGKVNKASGRRGSKISKTRGRPPGKVSETSGRSGSKIAKPRGRPPGAVRETSGHNASKISKTKGRPPRKVSETSGPSDSKIAKIRGRPPGKFSETSGRSSSKISKFRGRPPGKIIKKSGCSGGKISKTRGRPPGKVSETSGRSGSKIAKPRGRPPGKVSVTSGHSGSKIAKPRGRPPGKVSETSGRTGSKIAKPRGRPPGKVNKTSGRRGSKISKTRGRPPGKVSETSGRSGSKIAKPRGRPRGKVNKRSGSRGSKISKKFKKPIIENFEKYEYLKKLIEQYGMQTDVKITVGPQKTLFTSQKILLSLASPVFEAMFFGPLKESGDNIHIPDISPSAFKALLQFVNTNDIRFSCEEEAFTTWLAAEKYCMPLVKDICLKYLLTCDINSSNVWYMVQKALYFNWQPVVRKCTKYLERNTYDAIKSPSFVAANNEVIEYFVMLDVMNISEIELFETIAKWGKKRKGTSESLRKVLQPFLKYIRFGCMSKPELLSFVDKHKNFFSDKNVSELLNFMQNKEFYSLPDWCSARVFPRRPMIAYY